VRRINYFVLICGLISANRLISENDQFKLKNLISDYPKLESLIKDSWVENLELKAARNTAEAAEHLQSAAHKNWYPRFWFTSGVDRNKTFIDSEEKYATDFDNRLQLLQPVWNSQIRYDSKSAQAVANQAKWSQLSFKNQLSFNVLATYFTYLTKLQDQQSYQTIIENVKKRYNHVKAEVDVGKKLKVDLLEVNAQLLEKEYELTQSQNEASQSFQLLELLVNKELERAPLKSEKISLLKLPKTKELIDRSLKNNPELLQAKEKENELTYEYTKLKSELVPEVYLTGSYGYMSEGDFDIGSEEESWNAGVKLVWEFGDLTRGSRKLSALRQREASTDLRKYIQKSIPNDIKTTDLQLRTTAANLASLEKRIEQQAELYRTREEQYKSGTVTITDLSIAEDNLLESQLNFNNAKALYNITVMQLWILSGGEGSDDK